MTPYDAVVLAGGAATRLGGRDKPALTVGGATLLDRVLGAVATAGTTVVVGPLRPTGRPVHWAREEPPGGGPVAALAAGLPLVTAPAVAVLAADLPFLGDLRPLHDGLPGHDGAVLADADGHPQWLAGLWRSAALREALADAGDPAGLALRRVVAALDVVTVGVSAAGPPPWLDCDTDAALAEARRWA